MADPADDASRPPTSSNAEPVVPARRADPAVRVIGLVVMALGVVFVAAGVVTYAVVSSTLSAEHITVSDDAQHFAGEDVAGPLTAYYQADVIATHAEEIGEGKTYSELDQDDPRRETVMTASFLRASLFTSVVAFGVAALVAVLGVVLVLLGVSLVRLSRGRVT
jgi:hypothetical protein